MAPKKAVASAKPVKKAPAPSKKAPAPPKKTHRPKVAPPATHTHSSTPAEFQRVWTAHRGKKPLLLFVYSETCPYCVVVQPVWQAFVATHPAVSTASVPSAAFSAPGVQFNTVPFFAMVTSKGKVHKFDEFLALQPKGKEGRTVENLKRFAVIAAA